MGESEACAAVANWLEHIRAQAEDRQAIQEIARETGMPVAQVRNAVCAVKIVDTALARVAAAKK